MKWDTLKIDDQLYWSWIFIVSDFISRIFHQYWCQNWRPIPLVVDFHSIRFHFTNFFIDFQKTNENLFSWSLLVKMNIMDFSPSHTTRIIGFTLDATSSAILYIFGIGMTSRFQNCAQWNPIYCRFWFTVLGIKGTAPSSENSKSFIR